MARCPHCGNTIDAAANTFPVVDAMEHASRGRYVVPVDRSDGPIRAHSAEHYSSPTGFRYESNEVHMYWRRNQYKTFMFFVEDAERGA